MRLGILETIVLTALFAGAITALNTLTRPIPMPTCAGLVGSDVPLPGFGSGPVQSRGMEE